MFGFIKNFFGGILGFFGGIFSFGKSKKQDKSNALKTRKGDGYFLELDESQAPKTDNGSKPAAAKAVKAESAPAPKPEPAKTPAAVATAAPAKVESAKAAAPAATANGKSELQPEPTFAPKYLVSVSNTNGRRRPGANMNSFLDMARQVKTSR